MTPQRVTLITLGVRDLARARAFYESLGWRDTRPQEGIVFYQLNGLALGLFPLADLAKDQTRNMSDLGTGAMTLAINYGSESEVDTAYAAAIRAGAAGLKRPE